MTLAPGTRVGPYQIKSPLGEGRVTRDGRFLINQLVEAFTTTPITLILNWSGELKR